MHVVNNKNANTWALSCLCDILFMTEKFKNVLGITDSAGRIFTEDNTKYECLSTSSDIFVEKMYDTVNAK